MNASSSRGTIVLLACVVVGTAGCGRQPRPVTAKQAREIMGTLAEVTAVAADQTTAQAAVEAAYAAFERVNSLMSDYRDDSEISRLNSLPPGESLVVSPETFFVLQRAAEVSQASGGAFDVTCRPLVSLWKLAGENNRLPDPSAISDALTTVGWTKLALAPSTRRVTKAVPGMQIDVGGIAKGYALDLAAQRMKAAGATSGLIDVGGDIVAMGRQPSGEPWRIGVQHPFQSGLIMKLALSDRAVATSGNQQRFTVIAGQRYSHIIDPRNGRPTEQAPSVTVIAPDGITADAWATVFSVLSVEQGMKKAEKLPDVEVMWISGDATQPQITTTPGFGKCIIP
ncbi:MAG: FAD:protein FMN transferase [Phycisphaerae bacterium]